MNISSGGIIKDDEDYIREDPSKGGESAADDKKSEDTGIRDTTTAFEKQKEEADPISTIVKREGDAEGKIRDLLQLLERGCQEEDNLKLNKTACTIYNGQVLVALKEAVNRDRGRKWEGWADANIPYLNKRTRQNWMNLGKCGESGRYSSLGEDRLLKIINRQKRSGSATPITDFLRTHGVDPGDPAIKVRVDEVLKVRPTRTTSTLERQVEALTAKIQQLLDHREELAGIDAAKKDTLVEKTVALQTALRG